MKKTVILAAVSTALTLIAQQRQRSEWIKFNPVTPLTAASFARPPAADLPWVASGPAELDRSSLVDLMPAVTGKNTAGVLFRRRDAATRTDYYFFYNQGIVSPPEEPRTLFEPATGEPVDLQFSLEGRGEPYVLDAWSGEITPIVDDSSSVDRVNIRIKLSRDNGVLVALSEQPNRFGIAAPAVHVTKTSADGASMNQGALVIHAAAAGTYNTTLSNGRTVQSAIGAVPPPIDLTHGKWHLAAEDWQPANPYAATFGPAASQTRKDRVELDLDGLKPWPEIPALQNAAGLGTYSTTFDLPATYGATLSLGEVFDTFIVTINDRAVAVDQLSAERDIGPYLKAGKNTIVIRVATTLNNRLAKIDTDVANRGLIQPYGLVGPVRLTPYATPIVWSARK